MNTKTLNELSQILAAKWDKETVETVTNLIELKVNKDMKSETQALATKDDLRNLEIRLVKWTVALWLSTILTMVGLHFNS